MRDMKHWSTATKVILGVLVLFAIAQAFHPAKNKGNAFGPTDITTVVHVPENMLNVLNRCCFNCHSNNTEYWWYDKVTPVNYWINSHIEKGKKHLNFTTFGTYPAKKQRKKLEDVAKVIEKDEMPLSSFTFVHRDAKLSEAEGKALIQWAHEAQNSLKNAD